MEPATTASPPARRSGPGQQLGSCRRSSWPSRAPRFTLPPDRVHGRFPPPGALDDFADVLPHIVLNSPTLPWQREPGRTTGRSSEPWLALLVLDQPALRRRSGTGTLKALVPTRASARRREPARRIGHPCQYIDLEALSTRSGRVSASCVADARADASTTRSSPSWWATASRPRARVTRAALSRSRVRSRSGPPRSPRTRAAPGARHWTFGAKAYTRELRRNMRG